jgi:superfamily II DNA or RNA helicase
MARIPTNLANLDADRVLAPIDPVTIAGGREHVRQEHVRVLSVGDGILRGVCQGDGRAVFIVNVIIHGLDGDLVMASDCTCPVGIDCEHGVALFLTAHTAAELASGSSRFADHTATDWRRVLAPLDHEPPSIEDLAIQFEVEIPRPTRWAARAEPSLAIRPVRRGKKGRWIRSGAEWRDLTSSYGRDRYPFAPDQIAAVQALSVGFSETYYGAPKTLVLTRSEPSLWSQLRHAAAVGVPLVDATGREVALAAEPASVRVEVQADGRGDLSVAGAIEHDGRRLDPNEVHPLGGPVHGFWYQDQEDLLHLVPLQRVLHRSLADIVAEGLYVPAHDVDEFLDRYPPLLAPHALVASPDGSVSITTNVFEGIALTIERHAPAAAELRWLARYRRGGRVTDHPVHARAGIGRDADAEVRALHRLDLTTLALAALADPHGRPRSVTVTGVDLPVLFDTVVPQLVERGVVVDVLDTLPPLREATEGPDVSFSVSDGSGQRDGTDWFDLDVTVTVDGEQVHFPTLFEALDRDDEVLILPSGTWLRLDRPEFEKLRSLLVEARGLAEPNGEHAARINRFHTSWWEELSAIGAMAAQSAAWEQAIASLADLSAPEPVAPSPHLKAELRPYQQQGLDWLAFLHEHRLGGILADDMGLGKTIQTLALCLHIKAHRPDARFLVVAPTSVVDNWAREAERFAPTLTVRTIQGTKARRGTDLAEEIEGADVVVTSYALLRIEFEAYDQVDWELLLLDEAQFVKNRTGKTHGAARKLRAGTKIAITGTPLENSLMDLWSLLSITAPGLYPDPSRFSATFRKPIEAGERPDLLATLHRRIAPLMRRRTKGQVLAELPPKIEQTVEVELNSRHERIYQTQFNRQRQKILGLVDDVTKNRFEIFQALTLLRQLALDPALVEDDHDTVGSAKIDRLLDDLDQIVAEGHRALVFSQFTRFLGRIKDRLDAAGIPYAYLDGSTTDRAAAIAQFKDGEAPVFLISLKAGGFGLNLTEADYCFVMDPWWNPAAESQAVDRAHRIGQENPVVVYRYVSAGTIEEKVMELKARKAALFDSVVDADGALSGALSESDIRGLLDLGA